MQLVLLFTSGHIILLSLKIFQIPVSPFSFITPNEIKIMYYSDVLATSLTVLQTPLLSEVLKLRIDVADWSLTSFYALAQCCVAS